MESKVPKEVQERVAEVVGSPLLALSMLQLELKADKRDMRFVAVSDYRLHIFVAKSLPNVKLELSVPVLDVQALESKLPNKLVISTETKRLTFFASEENAGETDAILAGLVTALSRIYPKRTFSEMVPRMDVAPATRLQAIQQQVAPLRAHPLGPCDGYSTVFHCMCNYHGLAFLEEVAWDIDNIYQLHGCKELRLADFDHLDARFMLPLISALEHNQWFTSLNAANVRLSVEAANELVRVMKLSQSIEELLLSNVGLKSDWVQKLCYSLLSNTSCPLVRMDLSGNSIGDTGVGYLCSPLTKLSHGLVHLDLSSVGMTGRGVNRLAEALMASKILLSSLRSLNLADNPCRGEDVTNLFNFLAQPNGLTSLNLSSMEYTLELMFGALIRGCAQHLQHLDLSRNSYSVKRAPEVPLSWKQFFASASALESVNLADCSRLPNEAIQMLLTGLTENTHLSNVHLNLSGLGLGLGSAFLPASGLPACLTSLDLSNNGFDGNLANVLQTMAPCRNLKCLVFDRNLQNAKSRQVSQVMDAFVQLIHEEDSALESLSLVDCRLKMEAAVLINALGANPCLTHLDLSGNQMGDAGARMLAKALLVNSHLRSVAWDRNGTSIQGLQDVAAALSKNFTVCCMPLPVHDAAVAIKLNPRTEQVLRDIEQLLMRNLSPRKFSSDCPFRLQQGFLLSSSQKLLDELEAQLQNHIKEAEANEGLCEVIGGDLQSARDVLHDSRAVQQVLLSLEEVPVADVAQHLTKASDHLQVVMEEALQSAKTEMVDRVKSKCPEISQGLPLEKLCARATLPANFARSLVVEQAAADANYKLRELSFGLAAALSDALIDRCVEALDKWQGIMGRHLHTASAAPSPEEAQAALRRSLLRSSQADEPLPQPVKSHASRKSVLSRCRPQSNFDASEGDSSSERPSALDLRPQSPVPAPRRRRAMAGESVRSLNQGNEVGDSARNRSCGETEKPSKAVDLPADVIDIPLDDTDGHLDKSLESLTESSELTDASTMDSAVDSRESTPSSEAAEPPLHKCLKKSSSTPSRSLDSLPTMDSAAPPLQHLAKSRPKRAKTRAATRATVARADDPLLDAVQPSTGMDAFYANRPLSPSGQAPPSPVAAEDNDKTTVKKRSVGSSIVSLFSRKSPGSSKKSLTEPLPKTEEVEVVSPEPKDETPLRSAARPPAGAALLPGMGGPQGVLGGKAMLEEMKVKRSTMITKVSKPKEEPSAKYTILPAHKEDEVKAKPVVPSRPKQAPKPAPKPVSTKLHRKPSPPPAAATPPKSAAKTPSPQVAKQATPETHSASEPIPVPSKSGPYMARRFSVREYLKRFQEPEADGSVEGETPERPTRSKRSSVLEKAAFLDRNSNETDGPRKTSAPLASKSSGSLPRDEEPPTEEAQRRSLPLLGEPAQVSRLDVQLSKSVDGTDSAASSEKSKTEEVTNGSEEVFL